MTDKKATQEEAQKSKKIPKNKVFKCGSIDVSKTLSNAKTFLDTKPEEGSVILESKDQQTFTDLLTITNLLLEKLGINSSNSSVAPSADPNREKTFVAPNIKKPGAQKGHDGSTLTQELEPDEVVEIKVDQTNLPKGKYVEIGFIKKQVVQIEISRHVTEYRAQQLRSAKGQVFTATFPDGVEQPIQYGNSVKSAATYLSLFQMMPYDRLSGMFKSMCNLPVSPGTLYNFNKEAYDKLVACGFDKRAQRELIKATVINTDETGVNIGGKRNWLHCVRNETWTLFEAHAKRGIEAMEEMGVLPDYQGTVVHDHWKPYYAYTSCQHALCNAHHLRELKWVEEKKNQGWSKKLQKLLCEMNNAVSSAPKNRLDRKTQKEYRQKYFAILRAGEKECPYKVREPDDKTKRKVAQTKERNLLDRLRIFADDVLRFMKDPKVPFTNNGAENDIRMTKVHQKISGCFRSFVGAEIFCLVRSYLLTCQKQDIQPFSAMQNLFNGTVPSHLTCIEIPESESSAVVA